MKPPPLQLDYLVPPRRARWPGMLVLAASIGLAGWLLHSYVEAREELTRIEAAADLARPQRRAAPAPSNEEEIRRAEAVVRSLTLPWGGLIRAIEQAATREVTLLQLEPNAETRVVRLTAEAKTREAMFDYLRRLGAASGIGEVHLVQHQILRDEPQRPLQFSVQAQIRSAQ